MPPVIGTAFIDVRPDMTGFAGSVQGAMGQTQGAAQKAGEETGTRFGSGLKTTLAVAAGSMLANFATQGLAKVTEFIGGSIDEASNLSETLNKVSVVFGTSSAQVTAWAQNAATNFGLSKNEALGAAATFGDMFSQLGYGGDQAASSSEQMVKLAADLGSFHNVDPSDVLERIGSAFRGEYDSIQKLIPGITAARVNQEALRMTGKASEDQLTAQDKALATQAILMGDSANAADDFAETSGGLANQQRIASAQFKDLQANLGQLLLPAMTAIMRVINDGLVPAFSALFGWIADHQDVVLALAIGLGAVGTVILVSLIPAFLAWAAAALSAAAATLLAAAPLIIIGAAVAALAYLIINNWDTIKAATEAVWNAILGAVQAVWSWISDNWPLLLAILFGPFGIAVKLILDNWDAIVSFFQALPGRIVGFFANAAIWLYEKGVGLIMGLVNGAQAAAWNLWSWLSGLPGQILGVLGDVGRWLYDAGRRIIQGLIDGIRSMIGAVGDAISSIAGTVGDYLPFSPAKKGPLREHPPYDAGVTIAGDLAAGLTAGMADVNGAMAGLGTVAAAGVSAAVTGTGAVGAGGPAVVIQTANFNDQADVETFMRQAAWVAQTQLV